MSGAEYDFEDEDIEAGETWFYKLENIDTANVSTLHCPVSATVPLSGDLDRDGKADREYFKILSALLKKGNPSSEELESADLNGNGKIDRGDILVMKMIIRKGN